MNNSRPCSGSWVKENNHKHDIIVQQTQLVILHVLKINCSVCHPTSLLLLEYLNNASIFRSFQAHWEIRDFFPLTHTLASSAVRIGVKDQRQHARCLIWQLWDQSNTHTTHTHHHPDDKNCVCSLYSCITRLFGILDSSSGVRDIYISTAKQYQYFFIVNML